MRHPSFPRLRTLVVAAILSVLALPPALAADRDRSPSEITPDVTFTLRTAIDQGNLVFIGERGKIEGQVNPDLNVPEHAVVQINLINGDGVVHDIAVPAFGAQSENVSDEGAATAISFRADADGVYEYLCTLPGHREAGMFGQLIVGEGEVETHSDAPDVSADPYAVAQLIGDREPREVTLDLEATELEGQLADGSSYTFWTFDDQVPGPFLRVRVGDHVTVNLSNDEDSNHIHSVDFHAVTGPGGGAAVTQVVPGEEKSFRFKAMHPGLYVYHCATPMVAQHIANGMYGMVLVEPEGGLSEVDQEFYVMQGEFYTAQGHGSRGHQEFSLEKMLAENPEHMAFNGAMDALTKRHQMKARVGETVRIFFGVGGPNLPSSFHVIGEIFDRVHDQASLTSPPLTDVQTTLVPPGGATMVEFDVDYPGRYLLVDHALARMEKGLVGFLEVSGEADEDLFRPGEAPDPDSSH